LGGYFTSNVSWRWIFYINLPLGAIALAVIGFALKSRQRHGRHVIDYVGAALLAVALSAIVLVCDLAPVLSWTSPFMVALYAIVLIALCLFVVVENRAAEPVLPIHLFTNPVFLVTSAISLIIGVALFGSVTYMPLFLQVVRGSSPTVSGLELTPMMAGTVLTSVASGHLISRLGRYKWFPIAGTALTTIGLVLLSRLRPDSSTQSAAAMMLCLGFGVGMVMQVMVIAVQNAVDYSDLGVATSGAILFRLIGGAFGTAVLGGVFSAGLARNLAGLAGASGSGDLSGAALSPDALAQLPPVLARAYTGSFTGALDTMFLVAACVAFVGFLLSWLLPERPLRKTIARATAEGSGVSAAQAFALPSDPDSLSVLVRGIIALADRDIQRRYISAIVKRAGLDLKPAAAWLLVKIEENSNVDLDDLSRKYNVDAGRVNDALAELERSGLVTIIPGAGKEKKRYKITPDGCAVFNRLVKARREHLTEISSEWSEPDREKIVALLTQLARHLVPETGDSEIRNQRSEIGTWRSAGSAR
jgi:DNA-binding MarR family transcriptional regulator/predicted MFS family arabinose efflux permease